MNVLVVHAHPSLASYSRAVCDTAEKALRGSGHQVTVLHLDDDGFRPAMSAAERIAYHSGAPILDPQVERHAELVGQAEAIVFVYPTWWAGPPAILNGWLERVFVPGVAFQLDPRTNRVRPGLRRVRRLIGISTYGSSRLYVRMLNDPGRRTILRALRMVCARRCRRTWLALYGMDTSTRAEREAFLARVERELSQV
jgi:putative NADPH-quinone reductase